MGQFRVKAGRRDPHCTSPRGEASSAAHGAWSVWMEPSLLVQRHRRPPSRGDSWQVGQLPPRVSNEEVWEQIPGDTACEKAVAPPGSSGWESLMTWVFSLCSSYSEGRALRLQPLWQQSSEPSLLRKHHRWRLVSTSRWEQTLRDGERVSLRAHADTYTQAACRTSSFSFCHFLLHPYLPIIFWIFWSLWGAGVHPIPEGADLKALWRMGVGAPFHNPFSDQDTATVQEQSIIDPCPVEEPGSQSYSLPPRRVSTHNLLSMSI